MSFGENLRYLRIKNKMTQEDLGRKINVTKANISKYENGGIEPNIETIRELASIFGVTTDELLGTSDSRKHLDKREDHRRDEIRQRLDEILEKNGIVKPGEDLTDEQLEWLMKLVDKAIEMTKMDGHSKNS